jgi:ferredoxin
VRGVKLNDPLARRFDSGGSGDCGAEGTCATCVVNIVKGGNLLSPLKEQEKQILANKPKWRMACRTFVGHGMQEGELTIQVSPRQW